LAEIASYARSNPQRDFGVHLTFTCEWTHYRWSPLAGPVCVPGLCAPDGAMWPSHEQVRTHAKPAEIAFEAQLQIERCLNLGVDVTHLDSHMDTLLYDAGFQQVLLELAERYGLPVRLLPQPVLKQIGTPLLREQANHRGILFPDDLILPDARSSARQFWPEALSGLGPGLTEAFIHIGLGDKELTTVTDGDARTEEYELFGPGGTLAALIERRGISLLGHRPLRQAQRALRRDGMGSDTA
jgi:hypothetical protein